MFSKQKFCWLWLWNSKKRKEFRKSCIENFVGTHIFDKYINDEQLGNDVIYNQLKIGSPCLITRFGLTEFRAINYFYNNISKSKINFPEDIKKTMRTNAGFFSSTDEFLTKFCCDTLQILKNADIFAPWVYKNIPNEIIVLKKYASQAKFVSLNSLGESPCWVKNPWTQYLKDKKVLVIHPFEKSIKHQYAKRKLLFKNPLVLPEFDLKIIKAVQGIDITTVTEQFENWFVALNSMYRKIDEVDFDIAIIGAGAFGMFLANYIKEKGKQAVHVAGASQLLFGIKGSRWIQKDEKDATNSFMNEHWIYPLKEDQIENLKEFLDVEHNKAYW